MATFTTNRGKARLLKIALQNQQVPTNLYAHLCTAATTPTPDTNTLGELTEYTGGGYAPLQLSRNTTDFTVTEDDANDEASLTIKDLVWTASGGDLGPVRWLVICDDNATPANREVLFVFDLGSDKTVSDGQPLTIQNATMDLRQAP